MLAQPALSQLSQMVTDSPRLSDEVRYSSATWHGVPAPPRTAPEGRWVVCVQEEVEHAQSRGGTAQRGAPSCHEGTRPGQVVTASHASETVGG